MFRVEDLEGIKKYFPGANLQFVPDVGHNVHAENPAAFLEMTVKFLTQS